eukprot:GFUD01039940.1.p1 GENE.GFUD01039940.1~~GFUD01039940.1.p1  ORF type:complete len:385 (-),score=97.46 GFUD01039940.1:18-1118(-)
MASPNKKLKTCPDSETPSHHQSIPDEIWMSILSYLQPFSLCSMSETSHRFHQLSRDPFLWTNLTIDWQSIRNCTTSVEGLINRSTKIKSMTVRMRTRPFELEPVDGLQIVMVVKKAKGTLTSLTFSPDWDSAEIGTMEIALGNNAIAKLGTMTNLTSLELAGDWIKTAGIKAISNLVKLEKLKMPGAEQVIPKDLKDLFSQLTNLKLVDISDCKKGASDMVVTALAQNNPQLEYLALDECELVTGKSLKVVAEKCPNLNHLSLDSDEQVNDPVMLKIASSCPQLTHVRLAFSLITDVTLKQLVTNCPNLSFVDLFGCDNITERGVGELMDGAFKLKHLSISIDVGQAFTEKIYKQHPEIQFELYDG